MKNILQQFAAGTCAVVCLATTAQAASLSVYLDQTNADPALPDGMNYLEVVVSDGLNGAIDFNVSTLQPLLNLAPGPSYGIQQFGFNFGSSAATISDLVLPSGWSASLGSDRDFDKYGFGDFDVILHTQNDNRTDPLQFSIVVDNDSIDSYVSDLSGGNAPEGNMLFAAHVAGFSIDDLKDEKWRTVNAAKFGGATVVPLPPAAVMMFSGLAMLGGLARRRRQAALKAR